MGSSEQPVCHSAAGVGFLAASGRSASSSGFPDVIDLTPGDIETSRRKRKRNPVIHENVINIDEDEDEDGAIIIINEKGNSKNKTTVIPGHSEQSQIKEALAGDFFGSDEYNKLVNDSGLNAFTGFGLDSDYIDYLQKYHDDYIDVNNSGNYSFGVTDHSFFDNGNNQGFSNNVDHSSFASQVDAIISPPWVEPSFPWLQNLGCLTASVVPSGSKAQTSKNAPMLNMGCSSLHSSQPSSSSLKEEKAADSELDVKFRSFKRFDTVTDFSDHHFRSGSPAGGNLSKKATKWSRTIQNEWKLLESNLPDSIFVRVYEERIDLMRAVIVGAAGTPYHDGLFFFDIFFPSNYPQTPPRVYYHSGGLRLNPNLYQCGKVCLSLLNTWSGRKNEMWTPGKSTMLQVLLSIQALVLNAKPYFNEPGYAASEGTPHGEKQSQDYSENTFILSCKTMTYTLRRPPRHFEDFVVGHFRQSAHAILDACKAYIDGAQVGTLASGGIQDVDEGDKSCSATFKATVGQIFPTLVKAFIDNGTDCKKFVHLSQQSTLKMSGNTCGGVPMHSKTLKLL